ncbi:MAG: DUF1254 domain-containing protein [Gaiellales bacterium]
MRLIATLLVAAAVLLAVPGASLARAPKGPPSPLTDPAKIQKLAADAYVWALAPEFVYRFLKYNALKTAPINMLGGKGTAAAAWNNLATNAGDASVLYLNSMMDLSGRPVAGTPNGGTKELVLTVPPSAKNYYVVNLLDDFINSTGSIGTRTTPSKRSTSYLIAGPTSPYAHMRMARIGGFTYRVLPTDTNYNWMLIRIRADSLVPSSDPASIASVYSSTVQRFALNTLAQFQANGNKPIYPTTTSYPPSKAQLQRAQKWKNAPTQALAFFKQAGRSLALNPLPSRTTGIGGTPMAALPAWVVPQAGAKRVFLNPSYGQVHALRLFRPLGLRANGYVVPRNWGTTQLDALQAGYADGQAAVAAMQSALGVSPTTNYWSYLNDDIGTYPNSVLGYLYRATVVVAGGSANVPLDAVYAQANNLDGTNATQLVGDNTYKMTFTPPPSGTPTLPLNGTFPPTVNNASGDARGFWSIHVYQTDPSQSAAPFITQASALNLAYSQADLAAKSVNADADTITVGMPTWGGAPEASEPVFFGTGAQAYGLQPDTTYYVASTPTVKGRGRLATYTFKLSRTWQQEVSPIVASGGGVPEQGPSGTPGAIVDLTAGSGTLDWGPVQPVSQLGSQQITSGKLAANPDGSYTIWFGPSLPAGAPATNWIPTPSLASLQQIYGSGTPVTAPQIRPMLRIYYPTPGSNTAASILPPPNGSMGATWVVPQIQQVK